LLEREVADLEAKIAGWTQSLGNPSLLSTVRRHIEQQFEQTVARKGQLQAELASLGHEAKRVGEALDVGVAIERLRRLDDLLASGNATAINIELAQHVEAILVHPDGRVVMRTHRLGVFEHVIEMLVAPGRNGQPDQTPQEPAGSNGAVRPRKTLLTRHKSDLGVTTRHECMSGDQSLGFMKLPEKWVQEDVIVMPERHSWAHLNGVEVRRKLDETGWSQRKLAEFFGVTPPTIRHALRLAAEQGGCDQA